MKSIRIEVAAPSVALLVAAVGLFVASSLNLSEPIGTLTYYFLTLICAVLVARTGFALSDGLWEMDEAEKSFTLVAYETMDAFAEAEAWKRSLPSLTPVQRSTLIAGLAERTELSAESLATYSDKALVWKAFANRNQ